MVGSSLLSLNRIGPDDFQSLPVAGYAAESSNSLEFNLQVADFADAQAKA
jgi:hypothetical protein